MMIRVRAKIKLYSGENKRQTSFRNGYRPLFNVLMGGKTSGMISLLDRQEFKPGEEGVVEIKFLQADCSEGTHFQFYESIEALGEGSIIEILKDDMGGVATS